MAWPYYRVHAKIECRKMQRIPFTWLYVLRAIQAGLTRADAISNFLGVPPNSAGIWLEQLAVRRAITNREDSDDYCLTVLGVEYLDSPQIEKLVTLPVRLTWDCVRGRISDASYDELRGRELRGEHALELHSKFKIPTSNELDLPECQNYLGPFLEEMGEEFDGAELLHIQYRNKPVRAIKRTPILLYGLSPENFDIRVIGDDGFDYDAARLVRECPNFIQRLPNLFQDVAIADFVRRTRLSDSYAISDLGFDPRIVSDGNAWLRSGDTDRFRTFPGQGIRFFERAFSDASRVARAVITENRIAEWDAFRKIVADALLRGAVCEVVLVHSQDENRERMDKLATDTKAKILTQVPTKVRPVISNRLKIIVKRERYQNHWVPVVMCDDEWLWCGSDMLPGGNGPNAHFGFFMKDKTANSLFAKLIAEQITDIESPYVPQVKVEVRKKRSVLKDGTRNT